MKSTPLLIPFLVLFVLAGCGKEEPEVGATFTEAVPEPVVSMEQDQTKMPETSGFPQSGYDIYVLKCISCHGDVGQGVGDNPKLVGLTRGDVSARLTEYRDGKTRGPKTAVMAPLVKDLQHWQIAALAGYVGE